MKNNQGARGKLYIVATPIGNLQDITLRAISTLREADFIACEDTRVTGNLLHKFEIKKEMIILNDINEENKVFEIIELLNDNKSVALVSDAGTPLISDPGYRLVREAKKREITVIPIPGPSAPITALSASGLPTDRFIFLGFLPKTQGKAKKILLKTKNSESTIIFYESPHRLIKTLILIKETFGDIEVTIARELTKIYEEIFAEKCSSLINKYSNDSPKGEYVILFSLKKI